MELDVAEIEVLPRHLSKLNDEQTFFIVPFKQLINLKSTLTYPSHQSASPLNPLQFCCC